MAKKRTSFALSQEVLDLLKELCEQHNRSQANMIEKLILDASKKD